LIYNDKRFFLLVSVIISILTVDVSLNSATEVANLASIWGIVAFIIIAAAYGISQYFVLEFVKRRIEAIRIKSFFYRILNSTVTITQYVLTSTFALIVLQILLNSHYNTVLVNFGSGLSYALAAFTMGILASKFFLWYRSNRAFVVLLYGVSTATVCITMLVTLVFVSAALSSSASQRNSQSQAPAIYFPANTTMGNIQAAYSLFVVISFVLLWSCTVMLLHQYSQKLGRIRLWVILTTPLVAQASIFILIIPIESSQIYNQVSSYMPIPNVDKFYTAVIGYSLPGILAGIMFGIPFLLVARSIKHSGPLRDYLIIAGFGLVLFEMSAAPAESIVTAPYPPFGLASVLFAGLSSYMVLIGLYYSAVSISENSGLRQSIREAFKETRLLDSIGTANMEIELQTRVMNITKAQANTIAEESGVEVALSDEDIRQYLQEVLEEIQHRKNDKTSLSSAKDNVND